MKKGVSLIVLVITIIVMAIIAGTVILSMKDSNHIEEANIAVLLTDLKNAQLDLETNLKLMKIETPGFEMDNVTAKNEEVYTYIKDLKKEYVGKVWISEGELFLVKGAFKQNEVIELKGVGTVSYTHLTLPTSN